jgi:hypothetical protein
MNRSRLLAVPALILGGVLMTAACSSAAAVDRGELESGVKSKLEAAVGAKAKSVTCPNSLDAEVDATTRCTLEAMDGSKIGVTVTVTSVDGGQVTYDAKADDAPME